MPSSITANNKTFIYVWKPNSNTRTCTINVTAQELLDYDITAYIYLTAARERDITFNGDSIGTTTNSDFTICDVFTHSITASSTVIIGGDNVYWCGIDVVLMPKS